jgi:hypothetical protein
MATLENDAAQIKGVSQVAVVPSNPSKTLLSNLKYICVRAGNTNCLSLPLQQASVHVCIKSPEDDSSWISFFIPWIRYSLVKQARLRLRIHFGKKKDVIEVGTSVAVLLVNARRSLTTCLVQTRGTSSGSCVEIKYCLLSFGIDCGNALDDEEHGDEGKANLVQEYLSRRTETECLQKEAREQEETESGIVLFPKPNDVLMGRGRPFRAFSGNQRWGSLIEDNLDRHKNSESKFAKTCLSMDLVKTVQEYGGRFLQQTGGGWKVLDDAIARDKTSRAFRPRIIAKGNDGEDIDKSRAKRMKHA